MTLESTFGGEQGSRRSVYGDHPVETDRQEAETRFKTAQMGWAALEARRRAEKLIPSLAFSPRKRQEKHKTEPQRSSAARRHLRR